MYMLLLGGRTTTAPQTAKTKNRKTNTMKSTQKLLKVVTLTALLLPILGMHAMAAVIVNASFESNNIVSGSQAYTPAFGYATLDDWTLSATSGAYPYAVRVAKDEPQFPAQNGVSVLVLEGGNATQSVSFASGGNFTFSIWARWLNGVTVTPVGVTIGLTTLTFSGNSSFTAPINNNTYALYTSDSFTLASGSHTLDIYSANANGVTYPATAVILDNASITAVPEPSSAMMLVAGSGVCFLRRRRSPIV